jgi:hypothetical protein
MKNNAKDQPNTIFKDLYMKFLQIYTKVNIHEIFKRSI